MAGILVGFVGGVALLNAPYQFANVNFSFASSGLVIFISLVFGSGMLWIAWRLIGGRCVHTPVANAK
jgi:hypothetical protein